MNMEFNFFILLSYFIGSIPFGLILAKIIGKKDIRKHGSGNIGATNVTRILGKKLGLVTLILDGTKGIIAIIMYRSFAHTPALEIFILFFASLGHIFPIWLKFKGGKAVATSGFGSCYLVPMIGITQGLIWITCFKLTKYSSLSSILATVAAFAIFPFLPQYTVADIFVFSALQLLIIYKHKDNIIRLLKGKESKFK